MEAAASQNLSDTAKLHPIKVLVVDDSLFVRRFLKQLLQQSAEFEIIQSEQSALAALHTIVATKPDVILLDVEMPGLSGPEALSQIRLILPHTAVILISGNSKNHVAKKYDLTCLGADGFISKPNDGLTSTDSKLFEINLKDMVKTLGERSIGYRQHSGRRAPGRMPSLSLHQASPTHARPMQKPPATRSPSDIPCANERLKLIAGDSSFALRAPNQIAPAILAIGSSTGGPQALTAVLSRLGKVIEVAPVVITQHMPGQFTPVLAANLAKATGADTREGQGGMVVEPGKIYLAPGGYHMRLVRRGNHTVIAIEDGELINYCKPSVDPLFESVSNVYGPAAMGCILTGMGSDGARGALVMANHGGNVIAQDEETSTVWGMPKAAAKIGACCAVLPLDRIAEEIKQFFLQGVAP